MSSVKISGLTPSYNLNANPAQSLFVTTDLGANNTFSITGQALGSTLYSNNSLIVGTGATPLPNLIAQFTGISGSYIQVNEQNLNANGTADYIVTADIGNDISYYVDLGITNSTYGNTNPYNSLGTAIEPLSGYLYVQGNPSTNKSGNLVIGTVQAGTETRFISGGINTANILVKINASGLTISNGANLITNGITTPKGSGANLIIDPDGLGDVIFPLYTEVFVQSAATANSNSTGALIVTGGVGVAGNLYATAVYSNNSLVLTSEPIAQLAYNQANTANSIANTALQNTTTITTNSNLIVPGTLTALGNVVSQNSYIQFNNSSFNPSNAFIQITASNNYSTFAPSNTNYMLQITGKANSTTRVVIDSFGQNTYPVIVGRMGRGSVTTPTAVQANDVMMRITGSGYTGTQFPSSSPTKIDFVASENFSDTNRGTQIQFWNTPTGSNTLTQVASFSALSVTFSGYVNPQKGFVYTPLVYPAAQTAITIDFANNAVVRAQTATGLVVTLSNLLAGKEVLLWVTNTSGTNQTFTHGVTALNSTVNSNTYAVPSTSTILARYMSIDGTAQNTFVAVTHA